MAKKPKADAYFNHVFINCPFDSEYKRFFNAIVFTVYACGFVARCALEQLDAGESRMAKIFRIIEECPIGVHDISRTELDPRSNLPRFNMAFELGIFLGAIRFGQGMQKSKVCVVLDREPFRYQQFLSDFSGYDIQTHGGEELRAISAVRDSLVNAHGMKGIASGLVIGTRYQIFLHELPALCQREQLVPDALTFREYSAFVDDWIRLNSFT
jgi:hypothetical protein